MLHSTERRDNPPLERSIPDREGALGPATFNPDPGDAHGGRTFTQERGVAHPTSPDGNWAAIRRVWVPELPTIRTICTRFQWLISPVLHLHATGRDFRTITRRTDPLSIGANLHDLRQELQ